MNQNAFILTIKCINLMIPWVEFPMNSKLFYHPIITVSTGLELCKILFPKDTEKRKFSLNVTRLETQQRIQTDYQYAKSFVVLMTLGVSVFLPRSAEQGGSKQKLTHREYLCDDELVSTPRPDKHPTHPRLCSAPPDSTLPLNTTPPTSSLRGLGTPGDTEVPQRMIHSMGTPALSG